MTQLETIFTEDIFNKFVEEVSIGDPSFKLNKFTFDSENKHIIDYYSFNNFINAFKQYPDFGNTGNIDISKKELAAFFAITALESSFMYSREIFVNSEYNDSSFQSIYPGCANKNKYLQKDINNNPILPKIDWGATTNTTKTATYTTLPPNSGIRSSSNAYINGYKSNTAVIIDKKTIGYTVYTNNLYGTHIINKNEKYYGDVVDGSTTNITDMATIGLKYGYYGRGPNQLSWNFNYGPFSKEVYSKFHGTVNANIINDDENYILNNPDLLAQHGFIGCLSAVWFWFFSTKSCNNGNGDCSTCSESSQYTNKPSPHDIITGQWTPTQDDITNNRLANFGSVIDIINGPLECSSNSAQWAIDSRNTRIKYYKKYCEILGVVIDGTELSNINLSCGSTTTPWGWSCTNSNTSSLKCNND
jgi:hypothetical protein